VTCAHWDFDAIFIRLLERLNWYELLHVFGLNKIKEELTEERIAKLYNPELKNVMNDSNTFYAESLHPLQNVVLSLVKRSKTPFFLICGTSAYPLYQTGW